MFVAPNSEWKMAKTMIRSSNASINIEHKYPMLSLNNAYSEDDVKNFYNKISNSIKKEFNMRFDFDSNGIIKVIQKD